VASGLYRFVAGARPVASDWNDYIAKQEMMVYASEAARDSDLATDKREGMFAYLSDKNWTTYYNGANWLLIAGRLGVVATGSTQSIPNNVATGGVVRRRHERQRHVHHADRDDVHDPDVELDDARWPLHDHRQGEPHVGYVGHA
jgi:hypothetical protein